MNHRIVLASSSAARKNLLQGAGVEFEIIPPDINEDEIQNDASLSPQAIAETLAQQKALAVAQQNPGALVIGGDQVLEFEGEIFAKSAGADEARAKLERLSGKTHSLISAVALARGTEVIWTHSGHVTLHMHDLNDGLLDDYMEKAGIALTRAVGGYELENHGSWLFSRIEGDYFTTLGMPLLPLLARLRAEGVSL